ncbi:ABC transporter ATP-binding protein [Gorillibacterium massiliense]|uniref:ABC transporter ATP-binding protein n=1 Tax=Gorillibacterium massiliense TaxID=1280390 RepID=UPI0004BA0E80|nr:ABC transporter ATP-binding protein [Gorillibacterium massiliense]
MLLVKDVSKRYENTLAVDRVSFEVEPGELAVLLGPNGAGKSTTIKCIIGLLNGEGEIRIDGHPNKSLEAKRQFGYVPETPALYDMLTVWEHMVFIAHAYALKDWKERAERLLTRLDLWDKKDKLGKELSKGMQQKVSICCALLLNPKLVFFDEPMIGLDPKAIKELKQIFHELRDTGTSLLISTHIIESMEGLWDRALIMKEGRILFSGTREEITAGGESLEDIFFRLTEGESV